jgi:hypothetical protein
METIYIIVIIVVVIIIISIIYYKYYSVPISSKIIPWVKIPKEAPKLYGNLDWLIDENFEMYRPWHLSNGKSSKDIGNSFKEYIGITDIKKYTNLKLDVGDLKNCDYFEIDLYSYPSFKLYKSYPNTELLFLNSKTVEIGSYFITLRTSIIKSPLILNNGEIVEISPNNYKNVTANLQNPPLSENFNISELKDMYQKIDNTLIKEGYILVDQFKSQSILITPYTPHFKLNELVLDIEEGQELLLIYPNRVAYNNFTVTISGHIFVPQPKNPDDVFGYDMYCIHENTIITLTEFVYNVDEKMEVTPFQVYIYNKR